MVGQFANICGIMVLTVTKFAKNVLKNTNIKTAEKFVHGRKASYVISKLSIQPRLIFHKKGIFNKIP